MPTHEGPSPYVNVYLCCIFITRHAPNGNGIIEPLITALPNLQADSGEKTRRRLVSPGGAQVRSWKPETRSFSYAVLGPGLDSFRTIRSIFGHSNTLYSISATSRSPIISPDGCNRRPFPPFVCRYHLAFHQ